MAEEDDNWDNFLSSIGDAPAPVETDDDVAEDENDEDQDDDDDKDSKKPPKETGKPADSDDEDDSDDDDSEDEDAEDEDDKGKKKPKDSDYKPRLKQFINDDGSYDVAKSEKAYIASSKEAVRLDTENKEVTNKYAALVKAIKDNPEAAKLLMGEKAAKEFVEAKAEDDQPVDPLLRHVKATLDKQSRKEYDEFTEKYPETVTDPERVQKIGKFLNRFGRDYAEDNDGELPTMKEALEAAYRYHGWPLEITEEERVAAAAKKTAATRRTPNKKTPTVAKKKNELEGFFAAKLGVKVK